MADVMITAHWHLRHDHAACLGDHMGLDPGSDVIQQGQGSSCHLVYLRLDM